MSSDSSDNDDAPHDGGGTYTTSSAMRDGGGDGMSLAEGNPNNYATHDTDHRYDHGRTEFQRTYRRCGYDATIDSTMSNLRLEPVDSFSDQWSTNTQLLCHTTEWEKAKTKSIMDQILLHSFFPFPSSNITCSQG